MLGRSGMVVCQGPVTSHPWGKSPYSVHLWYSGPAGGNRHCFQPCVREGCMLLLVLSVIFPHCQGLRHTGAVTWLPAWEALCCSLSTPSLCILSWHPLLCLLVQHTHWLLPGFPSHLLSPDLGKLYVSYLLGTYVPTSGKLVSFTLFCFSIQKIFIQNPPCAPFTWDTSVNRTDESPCFTWAYICFTETDNY